MQITFKSHIGDEWTITVEPSKNAPNQVWMHAAMNIGANVFCLMDVEHAVSLGNAFLTAAQQAEAA
jgi:hypothetical protein